MWIITAWQCISSDVILKGFKKCCISSAVDGTEDGTLWNDSEVSVRKMKALTVKMETVILIGKGR
jgi:hypothetical protein